MMQVFLYLLRVLKLFLQILTDKNTRIGNKVVINCNVVVGNSVSSNDISKSYFLLKKENYSISTFDQSLFQQKKPQSCQFATYQRNVLLEFLTSQTGKMAFPIFQLISQKLYAVLKILLNH